jgi:hypothetical protein
MSLPINPRRWSVSRLRDLVIGSWKNNQRKPRDKSAERPKTVLAVLELEGELFPARWWSISAISS